MRRWGSTGLALLLLCLGLFWGSRTFQYRNYAARANHVADTGLGLVGSFNQDTSKDDYERRAGDFKRLMERDIEPYRYTRFAQYRSFSYLTSGASDADFLIRQLESNEQGTTVRVGGKIIAKGFHSEDTDRMDANWIRSSVNSARNNFQEAKRLLEAGQ